MTNTYKGTPDARQSDDVTAPVSRFRPRYRALGEAELALHDEIKSAAAALEAAFEKVAPSRELSLGMTKLEEAVMWTVKGLTGGAGMKAPKHDDIAAAYDAYSTAGCGHASVAGR